MRRAIELGCVALTLGWAVGDVAAEPLAEARARISQCVEKQGEEYVEARDWLVQHPEALGLLHGRSWRERWVKRICRAWLEERVLYEKVLSDFVLAETHARGSVRRSVPSAHIFARNIHWRYREALVPLMVECLWKTGTDWRRYRAWRTSAVVEYLKLEGDSSILDPAMAVLVWRSSDGEKGEDPESKYPRMDRGMRAMADLTDQMAPYKPVELILEFGDQNTLHKLRTLVDNSEIGETSKEVLKKTFELLGERQEGKRRGLPVQQVGLFDLYTQFGDRTTLENMRTMWGEGRGSRGQEVRAAMAGLEKRLEREKKSDESTEKSD